MTAAVFDDETKAEFLDEIRAGTGKSRACQIVGATPSALERAMRDDEDFADQVDLVFQVRIEAVEGALEEKALSGSVEAAKFFLTNRASQRWANKQSVEHTGKGGGPLIIAAVAVEALTAVLNDPDTRSAALDFIEGELVDEGIVEADMPALPVADG